MSPNSHPEHSEPWPAGTVSGPVLASGPCCFPIPAVVTLTSVNMPHTPLALGPSNFRTSSHSSFRSHFKYFSLTIWKYIFIGLSALPIDNDRTETGSVLFCPLPSLWCPAQGVGTVLKGSWQSYESHALW